MAGFVDLFVAPRDPARGTPAVFRALVGSLVAENLVAPPATFLRWTDGFSRPLRTANEAYATNPDAYYHGDGAGLMAALDAAPERMLDSAVVFDGLNVEDDRILDALKALRAFNGEVVLFCSATAREFAFRKPSSRKKIVVSTQLVFAITGKGCPSEIPGDALRAVLQTHFGDDLLAGECSEYDS